jgi:radical SAM protein with 4Fe4S-binding SPASM domain
MDSRVLSNVIDDLGSLGVREVMISGDGEPFLHKDILQVVRRLNQKRIRAGIITNGTLIDSCMIDQLLELGIDQLIFSISAHNKRLYQKMHPKAPARTFEVVTEVIQEILRKKTTRPTVALLNVITRQNYRYITDMIEFGHSLGADKVYLNPYYLFRKFPKGILLTEPEIRTMIRTLLLYREHEGLSDKYDFIEKINSVLAVEGVYNNRLSQHMPCYYPLWYAKIKSGGQVLPCCCLKEEEMIMGNVYEQRFKDIWFSERYVDFRKKALQPKKGIYPLMKYCKNDCHDFYSNLKVYKILHPLKSRTILRKVGKNKIVNE